jgi:hypothetical protein
MVNGECQGDITPADCDPVTQVPGPDGCQPKGSITCPVGQKLASDGICYPEGEEPITPPPGVMMMSSASFSSFSFSVADDFSFFVEEFDEENNGECISPEVLNDDGVCVLLEGDLEKDQEISFFLSEMPLLLMGNLQDYNSITLPSLRELDNDEENDEECIFPEIADEDLENDLDSGLEEGLEEDLEDDPEVNSQDDGSSIAAVLIPGVLFFLTKSLLVI